MMVTIRQQFDNDDHYDGWNTKQYLVIHGTGNQNDNDEGNANYFCTGSRGASAHYFVDEDSITQVVKDDDCSWHCGDGNGKYGITNKNSIGIEMCVSNGIYSALTIQNTLDLVRMLMKKYNIPADKVVRHFDASRKNCPSQFNLDGKWLGWIEFKKQLIGGVYMQEVSDWAKEGYKFVTENKISDGKRPKDNVTREEIWTMLHNLYKLKT